MKLSCSSVALSLLCLALCNQVVTVIQCKEYFNLIFAAATFDSSYNTLGSVLGNHLISTVPDSFDGYRTEILTVQADDITPEEVLRLLSEEKQPILFKGGVRNPDLQIILDAIGDKTQNLFDICEERPAYNMGESSPCQNLTLTERMTEFLMSDPITEPYKASGAHVLCGEKASKETMYPLLFQDLEIMAGIQRFLDAHWWRPQAAAIHYAKGKKSGVPNFHMHFDHFLSYAIEGSSKNWEIFHPDFAPLMHPQWSGSSFVQTNFDLKGDILSNKIPLLSFVQEKGDVVSCPEWFVHRTNFLDKDEDHISVALNTHVQPGTAGFVFAVATWMGRTQSLYENFAPAIFGGIHSLFN